MTGGSPSRLTGFEGQRQHIREKVAYYRGIVDKPGPQ